MRERVLLAALKNKLLSRQAALSMCFFCRRQPLASTLYVRTDLMPEQLADLRVGAFFFGADDQQRGALHAPGECAELTAAAGCSTSCCLDACGVCIENTGRSWKKILLEDHSIGRSVDVQGRWNCDEVGRGKLLKRLFLTWVMQCLTKWHTGWLVTGCVSMKFNTGAWLPGDEVCVIATGYLLHAARRCC